MSVAHADGCRARHTVVDATPTRHGPLDRERFADVVANLVGNAVRYNRNQGQVDIKVWPQADAAFLEVSDTGIGITAADLPHIFERFYRVDKARSLH